MYQALYRKWRPTTFDEVVGQEHITSTLKNEIASGKPSHAYLLIGSRGTGKTTCAKLIAKAVNCLNPQDGSPCGKCDICCGIDNGSVVDVVEIDAASYNGVDHMRELREEALFQPNLAKYRVYIIDEAHALSKDAVNALLKILEEPPAHVIFILATTEVQKMPATIQSRCQRFDFRRIDAPVIAARLQYICAQEGIAADEEALALIARIADGGMRDALSLLDICTAHSDTVTVQAVSEVSGMVGQDYLFELAALAAARDLPGVLEVIAQVGASVEYERLCQQLIAHYRNLLVAATAKEPERLIICLPETMARYREQAGSLSPAVIINNIKLLRDAQTAMSRSPARRTELEIAAARLCDPRLSAAPEALLTRIEELEARLNALSAGEPVAAAPASVPAAKPALKPKAEPTPDKADKSAETPAAPTPAEKASMSATAPDAGNRIPEGQWKDIVKRIGAVNPPLRGAMTESAGYIAGTRVLIDCGNPAFFDLMRASDYTRETLKTAIAEVLGVKYAIGPYERKGASAAGDPLDSFLKAADASGVQVEIK